MMRRDRQRLEKAVGGLGAIFGMLADLACTHNPSTVTMHTWPPNMQQQQRVHLLHSKMSRARMCFIQQESMTVAWDNHAGATIHSVEQELNPMLHCYVVASILASSIPN